MNSFNCHEWAGGSFSLCFADQRHVECVFQANFIPADTHFATDNKRTIQIYQCKQQPGVQMYIWIVRMVECNLGGSVMCLPRLILSFWRRGLPITVCTAGLMSTLCFTKECNQFDKGFCLVINLKKHMRREHIEETLSSKCALCYCPKCTLLDSLMNMCLFSPHSLRRQLHNGHWTFIHIARAVSATLHSSCLSIRL